MQILHRIPERLMHVAHTITLLGIAALNAVYRAGLRVVRDLAGSTSEPDRRQ